eukprot:5995245-Pyramimonas_sp.AAC.1
MDDVLRSSVSEEDGDLPRRPAPARARLATASMALTEASLKAEPAGARGGSAGWPGAASA